MRPALRAWWGLVLSLSAGCVFAAIPALVDELVQNHRRLIVLSEAAPKSQLAEARRAGHYLFVRNQHLRRELVNELNASTVAAVSQRMGEFFKAVDGAVRVEGDELALYATFQSLSRASFVQEAVRETLERRAKTITAVRQRFGADVTDQPSSHPRPLWSAYLKAIGGDAGQEQFLLRLDEEIFGVPPDGRDFGEAAARARFLEWDGSELPAKSILLSFDDGPHATNTPRVLDILKSHGVHAIFFMVGRNIGAVRNGAAVPGPNADIVKRMVAEGHAVGNHSYSHPVIPRLDSERVRREIDETQTLIEALAPDVAKPGAWSARTRTLRFPYGARNDRVLAEADTHRLRSVMWNIDSQDWGDPVPESIAQRVLREVEQEGRGIILMHDIHARTADALPRIISGLKQRGYVFLRWDGARLAAGGAM